MHRSTDKTSLATPECLGFEDAVIFCFSQNLPFVALLVDWNRLTCDPHHGAGVADHVIRIQVVLGVGKKRARNISRKTRPEGLRKKREFWIVPILIRFPEPGDILKRLPDCHKKQYQRK